MPCVMKIQLFRSGLILRVSYHAFVCFAKFVIFVSTNLCVAYKYCIYEGGGRILIYLILFSFPCHLYGETQLDSLLNVLDREIAGYPQYEQKKLRSLDQLRRQYDLTDPSSEEKYKLGEALIDAYYYFSADSTRSYLNRNIEWAETHHNEELAIENKVRLSWYYACTGMYMEASSQLQKIDLDRIPPGSLEAYYETKWKIFDEMAKETRDPQLKTEYLRKCQMYSDSLWSMDRSQSRDAYWYKRVDSLFVAGDRKACEDILAHFPQTDRMHALIAYIIGQGYERQGNMDMAMCYYAQAAIADIRSNTKDHGALPLVSAWLLEQGDIERAYRYIAFSWRQYSGFGSKLRYVSNMPLLNLAENAYKKMILDRQRSLLIYTVCMSVLMVFLLISLVFIYFQLKRISRVKNELNLSNELLNESNQNIQEVNDKLRASNDKLLLANTIKEKYLAYFIQLCFVYISDMDEYRRKIKKAIMRGDTQDALKLAGSVDLFETKLNGLYESFDRTFLDIFPDFVTSFNSMLQDDKQIVCREDELLTTEIRIYALIKLGVTDYKDIARFLRCSINTIYNYRAKINSRLKVSKEEFNAFLKD